MIETEGVRGSVNIRHVINRMDVILGEYIRLYPLFCLVDLQNNTFSLASMHDIERARVRCR